VQLAYNVPYPQADQLAALPGYELISNPIFSWQRLDFNFKGPEAFRDINVRRAVAHAINKQTISKALGGFPIVRKTPVVPQLYFYDPEVPEYAFDPEKAKKMLDDAGWKVGSDGIRAKGAEKMSYRFIVQAGLAADETAQQVIIANLKAIGIEAKPDNKSGVAFREARYKGLYDILYSRWITSPDPIYSKFYGTTGLNNGTGYSNAALDTLLDKVEHTLDIGEQKRLYKDMQRIIYDDVVTVATVTNVSLIVKTKKLNNFKANPTNRTIFNDTSAWYLTE
jgi:peptide/nickel transport system substrate-binding protein